MFTIWKQTSLSLMLFSIFFYLYYFNSILMIWISLELMTWSMFFFFSINSIKISKNFLFNFFLIQSISSVFWLVASLLLNQHNVFYLSFMDNNTYAVWAQCLIYMILIVKMGLFPGHLWSMQIYLSNQIIPIFLMSTIQKIIPIFLMSNLMLDCYNSDVFSWFLLTNIFFIVLNIWKSNSLMQFIFFSTIMHYSIIMIMMNCLSIDSATIYFLSYWLTFFVVFFLHNKKVFYFNPNNSTNLDSSLFMLISALILGGFPPFLLFFFKPLFFMSINLNLMTPAGMIFLMTFTIYLFQILFFSFKKIFMKENWVMKKKKNFFLQDCYFFFSIVIFSSGLLFFLL